MSDSPRDGRDGRDAKASAKVKDASTRFMRVDQLVGSVPTVAMPAAQLLAAAAAATKREPQCEATRAESDDAPTRAMPAASLIAAAAPPAPTVALASLQERRNGSVSTKQTRTIHGAQPERGSTRRWRDRRLRALVAASIAVGMVALTLAWAQQSEGRNAAAVNGSSHATEQAANPLGSAKEVSPSPPKSTAVEPAAPAQDAGSTPVPPTVAADQLAAGDYAAALLSYQALARSEPEQPAFALVVTVLSRKQGTHCAAEGARGGHSCAE